MSERVVRSIVREASAGCWSALDVGCGKGKYQPVSEEWYTLDAFEDAPPGSNGHIKADLLVALPEYESKSIDLVFALDVIEHLEKADGFRLLDHMERIARRRVLVFTPNGFFPLESENPWMRHRSGWSADDFRDRGYLTQVRDFDYGTGVGKGVALFAAKTFAP